MGLCSKLNADNRQFSVTSASWHTIEPFDRALSLWQHRLVGDGWFKRLYINRSFIGLHPHGICHWSFQNGTPIVPLILFCVSVSLLCVFLSLYINYVSMYSFGVVCCVCCVSFINFFFAFVSECERVWTKSVKQWLKTLEPKFFSRVAL